MELDQLDNQFMTNGSSPITMVGDGWFDYPMSTATVFSSIFGAILIILILLTYLRINFTLVFRWVAITLLIVISGFILLSNICTGC